MKRESLGAIPTLRVAARDRGLPRRRGARGRAAPTRAARTTILTRALLLLSTRASPRDRRPTRPPPRARRRPGAVPRRGGGHDRLARVGHCRAGGQRLCGRVLAPARPRPHQHGQVPNQRALAASRPTHTHPPPPLARATTPPRHRPSVAAPTSTRLDVWKRLPNALSTRRACASRARGGVVHARSPRAVPPLPSLAAATTTLDDDL